MARKKSTEERFHRSQVAITPEQYHILRRISLKRSLATDEDVTISSLVREALDEWIRKHKREAS